MEKQLEEAVKKLADKAKEAGIAADAMHFSQAALNAANALMTLKLRGKE